ncbi:IPTL-CTERM sorting domain-containing protein [Diaphorobacter ruginosibacter]|uniref:IPTL-CTERM sorting domain-containing protein n=1 Tax=Diaphorobacter ruginosibacter TaxID=1715720 RepID=A0A7G9RLD9_9BURK|nr:IPTL-CTERM sorting domain-containing protein [Diaphorobacter ruginosibacter]QNN56414.1 IPTL-CTERM sorting domain-containing protein [Diaphorobacter ruginosibacter]
MGTLSSPDPMWSLTQSGSLEIQTANSISCNSEGKHTDNSYYRRFDLSGSIGMARVAVSSVDIGIEQASGGPQPVVVRLYSIPNEASLNVANLGTPIGMAEVSVANQSKTILSVPITAVLDGNSHDLVVEVFTPNGQAAGYKFFIGSNNTAPINPAGAPSYIRAPNCGVVDIVTVGSLGFPNMHVVMVVHGMTSLSVGGQVSGLTGSGLQLQLQTAENESLDITGNGPYEFLSSLEWGGSYSVAIARQPVGQVCEVSNPAGSDMQANVGNVDVRCMGLQSIVFTSEVPTDARTGGSYTVGATGGGSDNEVTFAVDAASASHCSISGHLVSFTSTGTCTVHADQAGNASYIAAPRVQQTFFIAPPDLAVTTTDLGTLQAGKHYSLTLAASGGIPPYTWAATDSSQPLPAGLSLSADGVLSGTPTNAGDYTSLVTVTDSSAVPQTVALVKASGAPVSQVFSGTVATAGAMAVTPVPTLGQWALVLLSMILAGFAAVGGRRVRES